MPSPRVPGLLLLLAGLAVATPAKAAPPASAPPRPGALAFTLVRETLPNGLRVVIQEDHASPTVSVDVVYDVGGRNEQRGRSGFAHLFEHMMFQGSRNVPRGEHFRLVTSHGGALNGTTNEDRTNYYEMLPSSELALALWLEADRMKSLDVSLANFENQRAVVKEEYRMRVENAAYVPALLRLQELVYEGYWPYEHSAIGTMRDLDAARLEWVRAFHDAYYAPNNAVLAIVGDVDPKDAMSLVRRYFGDARAQPDVPKLALPPLPPVVGRGAVVEDPHAKLAAIFDGWRVPESATPEHDAIVLAAMILGDGESSRLHRALVRERGLAAEVDASVEGMRGPDMLSITLKVASGARVDVAARAVEAQIADLARTGPTDAEMRKVQNRMRARFLLGLQSYIARAQKLAETELYRGDATLVNTELARYLRVTKEDVRRAVDKHLVPQRRCRVEVKPGTREEGRR